MSQNSSTDNLDFEPIHEIISDSFSAQRATPPPPPKTLNDQDRNEWKNNERSTFKNNIGEPEDSFYSSKNTILTEQEFNQYSQLIRDSYE